MNSKERNPLSLKRLLVPAPADLLVDATCLVACQECKK
jgi:hypothetical protein